MNNKQMETELIASEVGHFLRPRNKRKELVEAIVGAEAIVAVIALLLWVSSITG